MNESIRLHADAGQTMAEYVAVLGVITITIVTTLSVLSDAFAAAFDRALKIISTAF